MALHRAFVTIWLPAMLALATLMAASVQASPPPASPPPSSFQPPPWRTHLLNTGWTRKDGAPAKVFSMTQDGNGMLWFAASDGLYSFDGARFRRHRDVHGHQLHSPITTAVAAHEDTIWAGYQFGGISRFERGAARHYTGPTGPQGAIFHLPRMPDGTMWATGTRGLHLLDGESWRLIGPESGLPAGRVMFYTVLRDNSLLLYYPDGIYRGSRVGDDWRFRKALDQAGIHGGELLPDGQILINSLTLGLQLFDPDSGAVRPHGLPRGSLPMHTYWLDRQDRLWANTGDGIQVFDSAARPLQQFTPSNGLTGKNVTAAMSDREGNVWLVTENGVDRIREARLATIALPDGISGPPGVVPGDDGAVWVINYHHKNAFPVPSFVIDRNGKRRTMPVSRVSSSVRQSDGTLWLASDGMVSRVRGESISAWQLPPELGSSTIQALTVGPDGALWVSVVGKGVHAWREGAWHAAGGYPELGGQTAISLTTDRAGRIWFGYVDNQIAVLDAGVLRRFGKDDGLAAGSALAIVEGRDRMWIGGDRGLAWFDGRRFVALAEREQGAFHGVSGIVERAGGELWLHDTGGLARIDAAALRTALAGRHAEVAAERFDHLDGHLGLPAQIRPLPTLVEASDGRLWYATSSSVGHIDPTAIARNARPPSVLVGAIRTDRQRYLPNAGLVLTAGTSRIEIDFTATALSKPERVRFRYRLAGQDTAWRDAGGQRQAVYTNLAPGPYTFEVHAANEDGVWSPQPARVAFRIEPAFTQTPWFKLAVAMAVLLAAWLLHRWRLKRVEAGLLDKLKVRLLERERIARTLHDTFLQSVQALVLRMHALMGKLPADSGMRSEVRDVLAQAEDVIEEGRQQVRQLRGPGLRHGCLLDALGEVGRELAASSGVAFAQEVTGDARELDPEVEDELFTIGREALSNAFHHAGASRVTLALDYGAGRLRLAVSDDGRGIPTEILARGARDGHWGLPGMHERARLAGGALEIDSTPAGTVVSVCIPVTKLTKACAVHEHSVS